MLYAKLTLLDKNKRTRRLDLEGVVSVMPSYRYGEAIEIRAVDKKASKRSKRETYAAHIFKRQEVASIEISYEPMK